VETIRSGLAELIGTFFLTFAAAGGPVIAAATGQSPGKAALLVTPALVVMAMIYAFGEVSGAHLNPAVTLAFAARGDFTWRLVPAYWAAQFLGATAAAGILFFRFGLHEHLGATLPHGGVWQSLAMELILTLLLVTVILATAAEAKVVGNNAALAVAGVITVAGFLGDSVSGGSMNPARSLGPALLAGELGRVWIYFAGPVAGAVLAALLAHTFFGHAAGIEKRKARGRANSSSSAH
jgi:aquaporin Z